MDEFSLVVLEEDLTNSRLRKGDVGTIVTVYGEGKAYEVEFVTFKGESVGVETLLPHQIREVRTMEIMTVRNLDELVKGSE